MYFNSHQERSGTIIQISRAPTQKEKEIILTFIQERGGDFTGVSDYREFFIRKLLQPEDVERYFKAYNLPFIQEGVFSYQEKPSIVNTFHPLPPKLNSYTMPFGNHYGKSLRDVPESYIKWILRTNADPDLLKACEIELKRKNTITIR
jgi:hypothetical protein